jgi:hypothetical protein
MYKEKTGPVGQKMTQRPGEFRMSKTWDHEELQFASLPNRKSKTKEQLATTP